MKKIIAIAMVMVIALSMIACSGDKGGSAAAGYTDGTHEATVAGHNGDITVAVTVASGKIANVELKDHAETDGLYQLAENTVIPAIITNNGTDGVDAAAGATVTSDAIIKGVDEALKG